MVVPTATTVPPDLRLLLSPFKHNEWVYVVTSHFTSNSQMVESPVLYKGMSKKILHPVPEVGKISLTSSTGYLCETLYSGVVSDLGCCTIPSQQFHVLVATTPLDSETCKALRLCGVNHGSI